MKRLLLALSLFTLGGLAQAATTLAPVSISSGTAFYNVDVSSIASTLRVRQNIVIADPAETTGVAPVDAITGLTVHLATSSVVTASSVTISGPISNTTFGASQGVAGTSGWKVDFSTGIQANQGGTWTVQPGNTANTTAWKVDGSAVTQPVSGTVTAGQGVAGTSGWKVDFSTGVNVNGTVAATQSGAWATTVTQGPAGTSAWKVDFSTGVQVNGTATVTQGAAGTSGWKVDLSTGVQARESVLVSSNTAVPTAVADAGEVRPMGDKYGRLITLPMAPWGLVKVATATLTTNTAETIFISTSAANTYNRLIGCIGGNSSATAASIRFRQTGPAQNAVGSFPLYFPPNTVNSPVGFFPPSGIPQLINGNWTIQGSASVSSLELTCWYVTE